MARRFPKVWFVYMLTIAIPVEAALLGVSPNTVRAWGAAGKIPGYRHPVNRYRMYKQAELEQVNQQVEQSAVRPKVAARTRAGEPLAESGRGK